MTGCAGDEQAALLTRTQLDNLIDYGMDGDAYGARSPMPRTAESSQRERTPRHVGSSRLATFVQTGK
jgi:hypothetical protein